MTELVFAGPTRRLLDAHTGRRFGYLFAHRSDACDGRLGAAHATELPYVFGTLDSAYGPSGLAGHHPSAELSERMRATWLRFAATGDPGWSTWDPAARCTAASTAPATPTSPRAEPAPTPGRREGPSTVAAVDTSERVGRYVRMVALEGQGTELAGALLRVADDMAAQPGCLAYVVNATPDEPDVVWVTEMWSDAASSEAALSRDIGESGLGDVLALLTAPPDYIEVTPLGGPGLAGLPG
ncbi:putative quinol monooxygenase [Pseudonocardia sp. ICBG162]|uniref:putative quinol monooxygenase n=2 Tax=unclassified Pseudonocardia TaxID=2619320 RepID=UPI0021068643|nr:antibiotic biosynthesis monooxygenase [Pseudonocardia sp. ICBG162]